jgi:hypothetical protein
MNNLVAGFLLIVLSFLQPAATAASNETILPHNCYLSTAENSSFLGLAFTITPRPWDEIIVATSVSWSPSTDSSATMLVIGNDTAVPTFWLHAIPTAAASVGDLVSFFDSRFRLCIRFSCVGLMCGATTPFVCSTGSSIRPGQFQFQSVVLATGSWYFSVHNLTFTPLAVVVVPPATSQKFFCANVTEPLTQKNVSSVRFSPRLNRGVLFHRQTICASVGATLDPITVSALPVWNSSLLEHGGLVPDPSILETTIVFRLRVLSGASQDSATVISTWNISIAPNNAAEATFRNVAITRYVPSASILIDIVQQDVVTHNYLALFLNLAATPINLCSLEIPQQRNQPFLYTIGKSWGASVASGATMPSILVAARRSDGSYTEESGGAFLSPLLVNANAYSAEGTPVSLTGTTSAPLANGVATFSSLALSAASAMHGLIWIRFQMNIGGTAAASCYSYPLKFSSDTTAARFSVDQRGESRFDAAGSLQYATAFTPLPVIRLVLQDNNFHRVTTSEGKVAIASVRSCFANWEAITSTGLSSLIPWCSTLDDATVSITGDTNVLFSSAGVASLMNIIVSPISNLSFANTSTLLNVLVVISVDDNALYFPLVLCHPSAPPLRSVVRFQPGVVASLFTSPFQSTHAVIGMPLPPIMFFLTYPNGTVDRRNVSLVVSINCAGAVLRHATSYFQFGVAQIPGVVIEHSYASVIRLSFLIYSIDSSTGARVRMQKLESGPIQVISFTKSSSVDLSSLPFALQFSRTRGFITHGVSKQDVFNNSVLPPFEVSVVRADHLLAGVRQSTRASSSSNSGSINLLQSTSILCEVGSTPNISLQASIVNGTAFFVFLGSITYYSTLSSLVCCLNVREAPFSCLTAEFDVDALATFNQLPVVASVSVSMQPEPVQTGTSIPSLFLSALPAFDYNHTLNVGGQLECFNLAGSFGNCSQFPETQGAFSFSIPVTDDYPSIATVVRSGVIQFEEVSPGTFDTLVVDGVEAVTVDFSSNSDERPVIVRGSKGWPTEALPLSFCDTFVLYGDHTLTQVADVYLWLERFGDFLGFESNRLMIGPPRPAIFDWSASGVIVPNVQGVQLEVKILPRTAISTVTGERKIANQILGMSLSCAQQRLSKVSSSTADDVSFIDGFATRSHGDLYTGSVQSLSTASFCDVSLFESLAESARHCEIFEGSSARCPCLVPVFRSLGGLCIGQRILISVCDHAAYCNDETITSVCNQIQPNVALQVFYVVGGTILGLVVIVAVIKVKAIARFILQARYRMHHNEDNVQSKQSAASINIFSS